VSKVLVTGGSGFIGTNLVEYCIDRGNQVLNIDVEPPRNPSAGGIFKQIDILDKEPLRRAIHAFGPDLIFHLAARTDLNGSGPHDYDTNISGVDNLIDAVKCLPTVKRVIFVSSMYVCRLGHIPESVDDYCPHTAYGQSKVMGERIIRNKAADYFSWVIVRPTSIWGPWFDVPYKRFFTAVRRGLYMHPRGVRVRRSYGFVLNTVMQLNKLATFPKADEVHGQVYYVADYEPLDPLQWARLISEAFRSARVKEAPLSLMRLAAIFGDALRVFGMNNPTLTSFRLSNMLKSAVFDLSPIQQISGDLPFTLEEGVQITVEWMSTLEGQLRQPTTHA
jgi:nucleoside-diphosphate-sugar epimerase